MGWDARESEVEHKVEHEAKTGQIDKIDQKWLVLIGKTMNGMIGKFKSSFKF